MPMGSRSCTVRFLCPLLAHTTVGQLTVSQISPTDSDQIYRENRGGATPAVLRGYDAARILNNPFWERQPPLTLTNPTVPHHFHPQPATEPSPPVMQHQQRRVGMRDRIRRRFQRLAPDSGEP